MNALNFPIGVKTFDVNDGAAQISFNPTDVNFVSALYDLFADVHFRILRDRRLLLRADRPNPQSKGEGEAAG